MPESSLVWELGFHLEKHGDIWVVVDGSGVSSATYISEKLWHALEEREREVERLRWFYENMRDADRRNLQMEYEAAREREENR